MPDIRIAVVDDDRAVRSLIRRALEPEGYTVDEATGEAELMALLAAHRYGCITLDLNLPGTDGITIARRVRSKFATPIIMVTGKGDVIDRVVGLEVGADDYIAKPFHVRELLARVRAVLRRSAPAAASDPSDATLEDGFAFAALTLAPARRALVGPDGAAIALTAGEFDILLALVRANGRPLTREGLLDAGHGGAGEAFDRAVDNAVARLRKKLPDGVVETVRAVGYRLGVPARPARFRWPPGAI